MKPCLPVALAIALWFSPCRAQELPVQDCMIVSAELYVRIHKLGLPVHVIGLKLKLKGSTRKVTGHTIVVWQPFKHGPYYMSDRSGSIFLCKEDDGWVGISQALVDLIHKATLFEVTEVNTLW
jgi:hypothetical protein